MTSPTLPAGTLPRGTPKLIDRTLADENFAHTVGLLGACAAWAETIEVGHKIDWNDRNMIKIPVEIALAFASAHANNPGSLGEACRDAVKLLESFRAIDEPAPKRAG